MKIIADEKIEIKDVEACLRQAIQEGGLESAVGRNVQFKLEKDTLVVSLDFFRGAMVRVYRSRGINKIEVIAHMPAESPLEIASAIIALVIYWRLGNWYGLPALVIAIGWPILLGMLVSRKFAHEVAEIVSTTCAGSEEVEVSVNATSRLEKRIPKARLKECPNCGNPIRLAGDLQCRKCGQKLG